MPTEFRILVTGSRAWFDRNAIRDVLMQFRQPDDCEVVLIHGDCSGADRLAASVAEGLNWTLVSFPANWKRGKQAGPERNARMLQWSKPDVVLAFPTAGSRGTLDMVNKARAAGYRVVVHGATDAD